jgi:hypothetical protein
MGSVTFGTGIYCTLNDKITLLDHPKFDGKGLFANTFIPAGELLWKEDIQMGLANEYTFEEMKTWPKETQVSFGHFAYQISDYVMRGPDPFNKSEKQPEEDASNFMNHSCDPTCWFEDYLTMTARRDIQQGEEITYDYATSELQETKSIPNCGCGSKFCRTAITKDDWKIPELQERYKNHFLPHVLKQ